MRIAQDILRTDLVPAAREDYVRINVEDRAWVTDRRSYPMFPFYVDPVVGLREIREGTR